MTRNYFDRGGLTANQITEQAAGEMWEAVRVYAMAVPSDITDAQAAQLNANQDNLVPDLPAWIDLSAHHRSLFAHEDEFHAALTLLIQVAAGLAHHVKECDQ